MDEDNVVNLRRPDGHGARTLLAQAIDAEVADFLASHAGLVDGGVRPSKPTLLERTSRDRARHDACQPEVLVVLDACPSVIVSTRRPRGASSRHLARDKGALGTSLDLSERLRRIAEARRLVRPRPS